MEKLEILKKNFYGFGFLLIVCAAGLIGCSGHVHSFYKKWSSDEVNHWHAANCEHINEVENFGPHNFGQWTDVQDGFKIRTCSVCDYRQQEFSENTEGHSFSNGWNYDQTNHWHPSTCVHSDLVDGLAEHSFGQIKTVQAESTSSLAIVEKKCICGYTQTVSTHTFLSWKILSEPTTTQTGIKEHECSFCHFKETEVIPVIGHIHNFGNWITIEPTEETEGKFYRFCSDCGFENSATLEKLPHTHKFSTQWTTNKKNHWHAATCEHTTEFSDAGVHDGDECSICGYVKLPDEELTVFGIVKVNFDLTGIDFDPALYEEILDIVQLSGLSGTSTMGEVYRPEFARVGKTNVVSAQIKITPGSYELSILEVEKPIVLKTITVTENSTLTETISKEQINSKSNITDRMFVTAGGIFGKDYLAFKSPLFFKLTLNKMWSGKMYYTNDLDNWSSSEWDGSTVASKLIGDNYYVFIRGKGNGITLNGNAKIGYYYLNDHTYFTFDSLDDGVGCHGNIMTLLEYENPGTEVGDYGLWYLFYRDYDDKNYSNKLNYAPAMPATKVGLCGYNSIFAYTSIKYSPYLPVTEMGDYALGFVFSHCKNLKTVQEVLPATELSTGCYNYMYASCENLTSAPYLPAEGLLDECYYYMFVDCSSLKVGESTDPNVPNKIITIGDIYSSRAMHNIFQNIQGGTLNVGTNKTYYYITE